MTAAHPGRVPGISLAAVERIMRVMQESGLPLDEVLAGNDAAAETHGAGHLVTFVLGDGAQIPYPVLAEGVQPLPEVERLLAELARRKWYGLRVEDW